MTSLLFLEFEYNKFKVTSLYCHLFRPCFEDDSCEKKISYFGIHFGLISCRRSRAWAEHTRSIHKSASEPRKFLANFRNSHSHEYLYCSRKRDERICQKEHTQRVESEPSSKRVSFSRTFLQIPEKESRKIYSNWASLNLFVYLFSDVVLSPALSELILLDWPWHLSFQKMRHFCRFFLLFLFFFSSWLTTLVLNWISRVQ
jgi:hypothetical protein